MDKKSLIAIAVCGILISVLLFVVYHVASTNSYVAGFTDGSKAGFLNGQQGSSLANQAQYYNGYKTGNETGYAQGYQDGYQAGLQAQNGIG